MSALTHLNIINFKLCGPPAMDTISYYLNTLDRNVQCSLKLKRVMTRPNAGSGPWLSLLLPVAVSTGALKYPDSSTQYQIIGIFSLGLLASAVIFMIKAISQKTVGLQHSVIHLNNFLLFLSSAFISGILFFQVSDRCQVFLSLLGGVFSVYPYSCGIVTLLTACPLCLTYGEAAIITQAVVLFVFSTVINLCDTWYLIPHQCIDLSTSILQIGLLGIGFICVIAYYVPKLRSTALFYGLSILILVGAVVPLLHILLQRSPILWILQLLFTDVPRASLVLYWVVCSGIAVKAINMQIQQEQKASTVIRKYFHLLAVAVYIPGLIREGCLLYLASGIILALFIGLETLRILCIPPLGKSLQDGFSVFADEKDQGALALTPIYLLAGCSLPLWLHPMAPSNSNLLPLLSGILSIGVGDTAASVCGTWFGTHRWPGGTLKTIEGTLACILSQFAVVLFLIYLGFLDGSTSLLFWSLIAIIVASVIEAKTDQVDNLVLPLVMYILLV